MAASQDPQPVTYQQAVTAVGRLLRSRHGEPRLLEHVRVFPSGHAAVIRSIDLPEQ
jgi:hypothetical protein